MDKPTYERNEDHDCACEETVIDCEWIWDPELECWICTGCAVTQ